MNQAPQMDEFKRRQVIEASKLIAEALLCFTDEGQIDSAVPLHIMRTLPEDTRAALAEVALKALPADVAEDVCKEVFKGAGWPKPALMDDPMEDARLWVSSSNKAEHRAYAKAITEAMDANQRKRFGEWVLNTPSGSLEGAGHDVS